ncbi:hypothetical protein FP828_00395, partial [bacterium]|nr:hypothetical protein [bacterium]
MNWTSPGDDGNMNAIDGGQYLIKYSSDPVDVWATMDYSWYISTDTAAGVRSIFLITGLAEGDTYYFYIETADEKPNWSGLSNLTSSWAQVVYDLIAPSAISNLTALSGATGLGGQITLKWTAPGDDGTTGTASSYELRYATKYISAGDYEESWTSVYPQSWTPKVSLSDESYALTGLGEGTTYFFALRAYDNFNWSVWTGTTSAVNSLSFNFASSSAPAAVNDLAAATGASSGEIDLSWTTPGDDGTTGDLLTGSQFLIKYSSDAAQAWDTMQYNWYISTAVAHGASSAQAVTGLLNQTSYYFYIKTSDEAGNWAGLSNRTTGFTRIVPPSAPTGFTGVVLSEASIQWGWADTSLNETGFRVRSSTNGILQTLGSGATYWAETALAPNTSYYRYAEAYNGAGSSSSSLAGVWTFAAAPVFTTVDQGSFTITLAWSAAGNSPVTRYALSISTDNFSLNITTFVSITDNFVLNTTVAANLQLNTTYWFRLWAYNNDGIASLVVATGPVKTDKTTPLPPSAVSGSPMSTSSIYWNWTDAVYEDGYRIISSTGGNPLTSLDADTTFWTQTGLSPNTIHNIYVEAWSSYNGFASSSACALSSVYTYQTPPVASATPPLVSTNTATIYWTAVSGAQYRIERSGGGLGVVWEPVTAASVNASFEDVGLAPSVNYTYTVYSLNDAQEWDSSAGLNIIVVTEKVYSISGYLRDIDNAGIQGIAVSLSGLASADYVTNAGGFYVFSGLITGSYSVTLSSCVYVFMPVSYSTSSLCADISGWDFKVLVVPSITPGKPGFVSVDYPLVFDGVVK